MKLTKGYAGHEVTTPPAGQIITTAEARIHLRLPSFGADTDTEEDSYIDGLVGVAGNAIETMLRRPVRPQTRVLRYDDFPNAYHYPASGYNQIVLDQTPIREVVSVSYTDENEVEQTLDANKYTVIGAASAIKQDVIIRLKDNEVVWPYTAYGTPVKITVDCGFADIETIPLELKHAVKILVADWYMNRQSNLTGTISVSLERSVSYLLQQFQRMVT